MKLTNNIVEKVFKDFLPLSIVKDEGFRSLMAETESRFSLPTRKPLWYIIYNTCFLQESFRSSKRESATVQTEVWGGLLSSCITSL